MCIVMAGIVVVGIPCGFERQRGVRAPAHAVQELHGAYLEAHMLLQAPVPRLPRVRGRVGLRARDWDRAGAGLGRGSGVRLVPRL